MICNLTSHLCRKKKKKKEKTLIRLQMQFFSNQGCIRLGKSFFRYYKYYY